MAPRPNGSSRSETKRPALWAAVGLALGGLVGAAAEAVQHRRRRPGEHHEPPDVATGKILAVVFGWVLFAAAGIYAIWAFTNTQISTVSGYESVTAFPEPQIQINPEGEFEQLRAAQQRRLEGYAWVDRPAGRIHVPIERAMQAVIARGSDAYAPPEGATPAAEDARARAVGAASDARLEARP
ncbi:hypothetical protein [Mangrovibrevibacter kandeliae]|uniref:hypothetical protein n=1 Tax=Mangrovibrevibacter kandeliae TaxID=2968473 RepID=UPI00211825D6|nr:hypothetical protein [Aurantimonas sp. CSK15Z-1]MCQ8783992.1 hypothetical protein [Aurantimonas sp. CSK15Z-1]